MIKNQKIVVEEVQNYKKYRCPFCDFRDEKNALKPHLRSNGLDCHKEARKGKVIKHNLMN